MKLQAGARRLYDELSWQIRGAFATESNRHVAFLARALCQPSEILARRRWAKQLEGGLPNSLRVPEDAGYLRLPTTSMPDVHEICEAGCALARSMLDVGTNLPGGKAFHRNKLANSDRLELLLRVALDRRMIAMAAAYLGVLPVLGDVDYFMSLPSGQPWSKSQLWHCDDDAPRQLKLFIYCNDVGEGDGPFEMVSAADSYRVRRLVRYRYAGRRYRVSDEQMDVHLPRNKQLTIRGARESSFVVDTARCFHKGSRIAEPARWRMVAVILYCTPNGAKLPLRLASHPGPFASLAEQYTDPVDRAVLGLPIGRA